jgi:hypothetical protein
LDFGPIARTATPKGTLHRRRAAGESRRDHGRTAGGRVNARRLTKRPNPDLLKKPKEITQYLRVTPKTFLAANFRAIKGQPDQPSRIKASVSGTTQT